VESVFQQCFETINMISPLRSHLSRVLPARALLKLPSTYPLAMTILEVVPNVAYPSAVRSDSKNDESRRGEEHVVFPGIPQVRFCLAESVSVGLRVLSRRVSLTRMDNRLEI